VTDSDPSPLGYHATDWTTPLLGCDLRDRHGIEISDRTDSRAIDRLGISWNRPHHELALRLKTLRQSKVG
jgi:hypothetical protein